MVPAKGFPHLQWLFFLSLLLPAVSPALASNPDVIKASHHDVSLPLSRLWIALELNDVLMTVVRDHELSL